MGGLEMLSRVWKGSRPACARTCGVRSLPATKRCAHGRSLTLSRGWMPPPSPWQQHRCDGLADQCTHRCGGFIEQDTQPIAFAPCKKRRRPTRIICSTNSGL